MQNTDLPKVFSILRREFERFQTPAVTEVSDATRDPYQVLVSCIISLRTKDDVTRDASNRIFALAKTPEEMSRLRVSLIEKAIYPAGFYRNKARDIKEFSKVLVEEHGGRTPDTIEGLTALKGVGRKTANLVITLGYGLPGICVDIHVHRITNRWGYVQTKTPDKTEQALRAKLPAKYWIPINDLLVAYGQNLCKPVSPYCSECKIYGFCERIGVEKSR